MSTRGEAMTQSQAETAGLARVFPRRTNATPTDALAFVGDPPMFLPPIERVHISVAFTWDLPEAERLARAWEHVAPVSIGGPATGKPGGQFVPGRYLRPGYTITSRGCPNHCWFCSVWPREGTTREFAIRDGWDVLDDNLLRCSPEHISAVFSMLDRQPNRPKFTGGLEASVLTAEVAERLRSLRPEAIFFAYDTPDDLPSLRRAAELLRNAGIPFAGHRVRSYVLCGYSGDEIGLAEIRMREVVSTGITPMAMQWCDEDGKGFPGWGRFVRRWSRPAIIASKKKRRASLFGGAP